MINARQLAPLFLAIALGSMPLFAQPPPETKPAEPASQAPEKTAPAPEGNEQAQKANAPDRGKDSPFDYRASEEISGDVPVSFPVDI